MFFRMQLPLRFAALASLLVCGGAFAAEEPWETVSTEPLLVKTRKRSDTEVKEVWAEGDINAAPVDIQTTVLDVARFTEFMPYMTEARSLGSPEADGATYSYSLIKVPLLSARDFIHKGYLDKDASKDSKGVFQSHWFSVPNKTPNRSDVIRLQISEGSWLVTPTAGGKSSHAIYKFAADLGGSIPSGIANRQNARSCGDTFRNIEREAQKRGTERVAREAEAAKKAAAEAAAKPSADASVAPKPTP